jgi:nucleoid-associated protein YgaU
VAARPRRSDTGAPRRPVYKVRPYDTLRSIARDTLDDPRRAGEILELNDGIIRDPSHLVVGQILELPEDARTTLRRSASRN